MRLYLVINAQFFVSLQLTFMLLKITFFCSILQVAMKEYASLARVMKSVGCRLICLRQRKVLRIDYTLNLYYQPVIRRLIWKTGPLCTKSSSDYKAGWRDHLFLEKMFQILNHSVFRRMNSVILASNCFSWSTYSIFVSLSDYWSLNVNQSSCDSEEYSQSC